MLDEDGEWTADGLIEPEPQVEEGPGWDLATYVILPLAKRGLWDFETEGLTERGERAAFLNEDPEPQPGDDAFTSEDIERACSWIGHRDAARFTNEDQVVWRAEHADAIRFAYLTLHYSPSQQVD